MKTHDSLGRKFPNNLEPIGQKVHATKCDFYLFERLMWHGDLPTDHLHHLNHQCGRASKMALSMRLRLLSTELETGHGSRYLIRPKEQYPNLRGGRVPRSHHIVYRLDQGAIKALKDATRMHDYLSGSSFEHQLMQSIVTAEIEIGTHQNRDFTYVPRHRLTPITSYKLPITYKDKSFDTVLAPDAHFAIDYGGTSRHFLLEVDRGTEIKDNVYDDRKTILRSLLQYRQLIGRAVYRQQMKTDVPTFALFIFLTEQQMKNAIELLLRATEGKGNNYILFRYDDRFDGKVFPAPMVSTANFTGAWKRAGRGDFYINK